MGLLRLDCPEAGIRIIRFDNAPLGLLDNAMTVRMEDELNTIAADPAARVLVLTGAQPDTFIRHFDLAELAGAAGALADNGSDGDAAWHASIFHRITRCMETMNAIVIAAINGDCMGVGYELALACDLRIASDAPLSIGMPEMHIAMMPGGGGTARLARLLGPSKALELICTATTVDPHTALHFGMVDRVVPDALTEALAIARRINALSAGGVAAAKRIARAALDMGIEDALSLEQREVNARLGSQEVRAALARYVESGADLRYPAS